MTAHLPSGKRRSEYLRVRLTSAQMALLRDTAGREGRNVSEVVRRIILAHIEKLGPPRAP